MKVSEVQCKTILNKSGLADYCLNCYIGCQHACRYCYARFMAGYTKHSEAWGEFVDVKINAAEVLSEEVKKKKRGEVFISSVCDGWQPLEAEYKLTRKCLGLLLQYGFSVTILTKSVLIERDFDLLKLNSDSVELGFTLTTLDEKIGSLIEPFASPAKERISVLKKAADSGIKTYVFLGPLLPFLTDKEEDMEILFNVLHGIQLKYIYLDRLNLRSGVWESVFSLLKRSAPQMIAQYKKVFFDKNFSQVYVVSLATQARKIAERYGMEKKLRLCF